MRRESKNIFQQAYNEYFYHSNNDLGLIYIVYFQNIEKGIEYIKKAGLNEYPFGQNNLGLLYQFYINHQGNAEHMYNRSSEHHFALAEYNLGYMLEKANKKEESIEYYIKASDDEDAPLIYHNFEHFDLRLEISKTFVICMVNLKLTLHFLEDEKSIDYEKAKKYFIRSLSKLLIKGLYKFSFRVPPKITNNFFSYLKIFIFNFPIFNLSYQPYIFGINAILRNKTKKQVIKSKIFAQEENEKLSKHIVLKNIRQESYESELDFDYISNSIILDKGKIFQKPSEFFDFATKNKTLKSSLINEIKSIIQTMEEILYTPPYVILFGRINIHPPKKVNAFILDINDKFYQGFGIDI